MKRFLFALLLLAAAHYAGAQVEVRQGMTAKEWFGEYELIPKGVIDTQDEGGHFLIITLRSKEHKYAPLIALTDDTGTMADQLKGAERAEMGPRDDDKNGFKLQIFDISGKVIYEHQFATY